MRNSFQYRFAREEERAQTFSLFIKSLIADFIVTRNVDFSQIRDRIKTRLHLQRVYFSNVLRDRQNSIFANTSNNNLTST